MPRRNLQKPCVCYQYYREIYHGSSMDENEFLFAEAEAEAFVNAMTFGRIKKLKTIPGCVKDAICSAADIVNEAARSRKSDLASENNDGYSVTYKKAMSDEECEKAMAVKVKRHLVGTGLTYAGRSKIYDY